MFKFAHDDVVPNKNDEATKKEQVATMFDDIAGKYDFLNRFLSVGIDIRWRKKALKQLDSIDPKKVLDVATGTADVAIMAAKKFPECNFIGIDISEGMLTVGRQKVTKLGLEQRISLHLGDSETIKFADNSFDAVTVAFGVRNFEHLEKGLSEIYRVLKPGGKMVVLEFSKPATPGVNGLYNFYMKLITPTVGKIVSKNKVAYAYLDESIRKFPEGIAFLDILKPIGFTNTYLKKLSLGICSIYCGTK